MSLPSTPCLGVLGPVYIETSPDCPPILSGTPIDVYRVDWQGQPGRVSCRHRDYGKSSPAAMPPPPRHAPRDGGTGYKSWPELPPAPMPDGAEEPTVDQIKSLDGLNPSPGSYFAHLCPK